VNRSWIVATPSPDPLADFLTAWVEWQVETGSSLLCPTANAAAVCDAAAAFVRACEADADLLIAAQQATARLELVTRQLDRGLWRGDTEQAEIALLRRRLARATRTITFLRSQLKLYSMR